MKWEKQAQTFENIVKKFVGTTGEKYTLATAAEYLGTTKNKYTAWVRHKQRPTAEDMVTLVMEHRFSADWLLLGIGDPLEKGRTDNPLNPDLVDICDTLQDLVFSMGKPFSEIAMVGGMTTTQLANCTSAQSHPPVEAVANWVRKWGINANYLLGQIGKPFLTEEQYHEEGPATWIRRQRGDFDTYEHIETPEFQTERREPDINSAQEEAEDVVRIHELYAELLDAERKLVRFHMQVMNAARAGCLAAGLTLEQAHMVQAAVMDYELCQTPAQAREAAGRYALPEMEQVSAAGAE